VQSHYATGWTAEELCFDSRQGCDFSPFSKWFRPPSRPSKTLIKQVPEFLSPGLKRPRREVEHSTPCTAQVKNDWSFTSISLVCFLNMDMYHFTFSGVFVYIAERAYLLNYFCPSVSPTVCPNVSARLLLCGYSCNFIFETFKKICRETPNLAEIGPKYPAFYMKVQALLYC